MTPMITDREGGLDLSRPDVWTPEEQEAFTRRYMAVKERTMPGHDLWIELRPDVLKRYRHYAVVMDDPVERQFPKIGILCFLHHYAIVGFAEGVSYQIVNARNAGGATKAAILSTLAVAFLQSGPLGTAAVAAGAGDQLRSFAEPEEPTGWPDGWDADPAWFQTGMDFTEVDLTPEDLRLLQAWYQRTIGEVPRHVGLLARHRPRALKAYRHRFEFAIRNGLPKQMLPLLNLQFEVSISRGEGIREALLFARTMGIEKVFVMGAMARGAMYGGPHSLDIADAHGGDILDDWPR